MAPRMAPRSGGLDMSRLLAQDPYVGREFETSPPVEGKLPFVISEMGRQVLQGHRLSPPTSIRLFTTWRQRFLIVTEVESREEAQRVHRELEQFLLGRG
jgi:hypothetical protein